MKSAPSSLRSRIAAEQRLGEREKQEDNLLVTDLRPFDSGDQDCLLLLLADGMGGHAGGAIASNLAVHGFSQAFQREWMRGESQAAFEAGLAEASRRIAERAAENAALKGMGCTLVAVLVRLDRIEWLSVGDSPLWLLRNGTLHRLNEDHSMGAVFDAMAREGKMSADKAASETRRGALRSALDGRPPAMVDMKTNGYRLQEGDLVLLASDGMQTLSEESIADLLSGSASAPLGDRLANLLDAVIAVEKPFQDNATGVLMQPAMSDVHAANVSEKTTLVMDADTFRRSPDRLEQRETMVRIPSSLTARRQLDASRNWLRLWLAAGLLLVAAAVACLVWIFRGDVVGPGQGHTIGQGRAPSTQTGANAPHADAANTGLITVPSAKTAATGRSPSPD